MSPLHSLVVLLTFGVFSLSGCDNDECTVSSDCFDEFFCNGDEACINGNCFSSGIRDCDDGRDCTIDSCDEELDECHNVPTDLDGDGHFDFQCGGYDCDDRNDLVFPGATELCDGLDNDCDDIVFEDRDGDSHFDEVFCSDGDDCDDTDSSVYPGAAEVCDDVDNNCSGGIDDEPDTDGDTFIDLTCGGNDCDDESASVYPGAIEACNGADDNCNGELDETFDCVRGVLYSCETTCFSLGTVECDSDCSFPDLPRSCVPPSEICNGSDDDCDGLIDNDFPCVSGQFTACTTSCGSIGSGICTNLCEPPLSDACLPPVEVCNGIDDNCNGALDEGFFCTAGAEAPCQTICETLGTGTCTDSCHPADPDDCTPPREVCFDFIDNDCDDDVDCTDEDCIGDYSCGF